MSLLFNMLSRLVITFLPRSKRLLISRLQSPSAVILEPPKIKSDTVSTVSPPISHGVTKSQTRLSDWSDLIWWNYFLFLLLCNTYLKANLVDKWKNSDSILLQLFSSWGRTGSLFWYWDFILMSDLLKFKWVFSVISELSSDCILQWLRFSFTGEFLILWVHLQQPTDCL